MLLESLGFSDITYRSNKNELRFSREKGRNPSAMRLKLDTLKADGFSINLHGNIYTLVMNALNVGFRKALEYIVNSLGLSSLQFSQKTKKPFSNFYHGFIREIQNSEYNIKIYDNEILDSYLNCCNLMFLKDGIDCKTQEFFNDGYDLISNRITIPQYTLDGEICGIMGRLNNINCPKEERWLPVIPCSRSLTLYGYHINYETIQQKQTVIIGESEKFVQQMYSMGSKVGLSTCGCNISPTQARHIRALMTERIVIAFDEGLEEEQIRSQAESLIMSNLIFKNRVGYIFDREHQFLPEGSKASPTDYGKDIFRNLLNHCVVWI